ncbi:beta-lactamase/transpeptidase-like protein [Periconia macrospinosa]|uniref:Beta-lactamase/transpeptidase-like protein n=1 Tax=Periconia macrospinosa TaxID=97972 RepID=A0A2V1E2T7_9PLEO|nr:beta-lactamase/transpeptidase-like protein [Periconia macrospinosa]
MYISPTLLLLLPVVSAWCPIYGPSFPPPKNPSSSKAFQAALEELTTSIDVGLSDPNNEVTSAHTVSVQLFNAYTEEPLYTLHREGSTLNTTVGVAKVDSDSIWRIASISKLVIVYLLLKEVGDQFWNTPVAKAIPELRENAKWKENKVDFVDWESVTLGTLAGHTSGVVKNLIYLVGGNPFLDGTLDIDDFGLPDLGAKDLPRCTIGLEFSCDRAEFFAALDTRQPIFAANTQPIYANTPYVILGYALESITGKSLSEILQSFVDELKLDMTTPVKPDISRAVIPYSAERSGYLVQTGEAWPLGGLYSTFNDLTKIGRSILNSKFMSENATRAWLKPVSFVSDLRSAIGRPWEIVRIDTRSTRGVIDVYGKSGGQGPYSLFLGLVLDYNFGFAAAVAGKGPPSVNWVTAKITEKILPALEEAAREEAHEVYAGTYIANTNGTNSTIVLSTEVGRPGLSVTTFTSRGADVLSAMSQLYGEPITTENFRLVPTNLEQDTKNGTKEVAWKWIENMSTPNEKPSAWSACASWFNIDEPSYGRYSFDSVVFTLGPDGKATKIRPRAFALDYQKV